MLIAKILGYTGMGVLTAALAVTVHATFALAKVDIGLNRSLSSTAQLAQIEQSIIQKNHALGGVITTANEMNQRLNATLTATNGIDTNIHSINRLNKATLVKNQQMQSGTKQSQQMLAQIAQNAKRLKADIDSLNQYLSTLNQTTNADKSNLSAMEQDTQTMDSKVPGVSG